MAKRLRDVMSLSSKLHYAAWRALPLFLDTVIVKLITGERLILRRQPAPDLNVAYEVFAVDIYRAPRRLPSVRRIVDVGANVGFSVAYWGRCYPEAQIVAFEPHPDFARQAARHIRLNGLDTRAIIYTAAASIKAGVGNLSNQGSSSQVRADGTIPIQIVDFFDTVGSEPIDLLKIDCEGGEYDILMDPRFESLNARALVMEWHLTPEHPCADVELVARLRETGWEVVPVFENRELNPELGSSGCGMVWGFRRL